MSRHWWQILVLRQNHRLFMNKQNTQNYSLTNKHTLLYCKMLDIVERPSLSPDNDFHVAPLFVNVCTVCVHAPE